MKRFLPLFLCIFLLCGCGKNQPIDDTMRFRETLLASSGCSFQAEITADYGDKLNVFQLFCQFDNQGNMSFMVCAPDTISGITGTISENNGTLTFDEQVLAFPLLVGGEVSPISVPWIFMHALRSGYIQAAGKNKEITNVKIDDSYAGENLQIDVSFNAENQPIFADVVWSDRRISSISIDSFVFL